MIEMLAASPATVEVVGAITAGTAVISGVVGWYAKTRQVNGSIDLKNVLLAQTDLLKEQSQETKSIKQILSDTNRILELQLQSLQNHDSHARDLAEMVVLRLSQREPRT